MLNLCIVVGVEIDMDDIFISLTIGRTALLIFGLLLLFALGAGIVMALLSGAG